MLTVILLFMIRPYNFRKSFLEQYIIEICKKKIVFSKVRNWCKKFAVGPTQAIVKEILKKLSGLLMQVT